MTGPWRPLPASLGALFTVSEANARGIGRGRLRLSDVERLFPGAYGRVGTGILRHAEDAKLLHERELWRRRQLRAARAYGMIMRPTQFFSGLTAAVILGLPVPQRSSEDIEVASFAPDHPPRMVGVRGRKISRHLVTVTTYRGFRVTSPASTWVMLAGELELEDLVALGDAVLRHPRIGGTTRFERPPLATAASLNAEIRRGRRVGLASARRALPLLTTKSASAPESHLHLRFREWGLPDPALDHDVFDAAGQFLGCTEIAYPEFKVAFEYEGDHHRVSQKQWDRDIEKARDYTAAAWITIRVTAHLLYTTPEDLRRIAESTLRARGWRPRKRAAV